MASWKNEKHEEPIGFTPSGSEILPSEHPLLSSSSSSSSSVTGFGSKNTSALENSRRLYIGNLHQRVTGTRLFKMLKPFGVLEAFKYVNQRVGPDPEARKRYALVTFSTLEAVQNCMSNLNGKVVFGRGIRIRRAPNAQTTNSEKEETLKALLPVLGFNGSGIPAKEHKEEDTEELKLKRKHLIDAIEQKLQAIKRQKNES